MFVAAMEFITRLSIKLKLDISGSQRMFALNPAKTRV